MGPSSFGQEALGRAVRGAGIDAPPRWFDEVGSTNAEALTLARVGAPEGTVLATGHQTAGRGRMGRSWVDEPGGSLLFSVILRPAAEPSRAPLLTLLAAVEMIAACEVPAMRSKWPNDLVIDDRKVGGILAEAELSGGTIEHVVLGIGVNLGSPEGGPPSPGATTLAAEGVAPEPEAALRRFLTGLRTSLAEDPSLSGVAVRYAALCSTIGRTVAVRHADGSELEGVAVGIDAGGALVVESAGGRSVVTSGEVSKVRGAEAGE